MSDLKQISFIDDIFEDIGADKEQQMAIKFWLDYVAKETKETEVFAIDIPKIGVLHRNRVLTQNSKKYLKKDSEEYSKIMDMLLEMKYFKEQKNEKTPHCKTPYTYIASGYLKNKYELPQIFNSEKQVKEVYSAIEKEQKKQYDRGF